MEKIGVSVAYAGRAGIGTALTAVIGIAYFRESATIVKFASI